MINNVSKLTFKADKKPVLPQKNEQVSLLKIYNQGDKATLSTEESKKQNPPVNKHLFSLRNITIASFLVLGSVMLFAVLSPADIPKSWEKVKEKAKEIKTRIVEFFKSNTSSGNEGAVSNPLSSGGSGASNEAGGVVTDSLGKMISAISTISTKVKEKATEKIKVIKTTVVKPFSEKISSAISGLYTKTKENFEEIKIKIDNFLKKPVVVKKEAPKVSVKLNTGTSQDVVKLDKVAEKAKVEVTQLAEKLENKTMSPETFVDKALTAIEKPAAKISSSVDATEYKSAQAELKEITSSVSEPIIDIVDRVNVDAGQKIVKLTENQLETATQELVANADNITDKVIRIEEGFKRKVDDIAESLPKPVIAGELHSEAGKKVEGAYNQAVKELHASGEPEKAKFFAEQYEGLVERANPDIIKEKMAATAEAKKLIESLEQNNQKIKAFKTLIEAKDAKKDFIEIQSAYNQTIAALKQAGATEQVKSFEAYYQPVLKKLEDASKKAVTQKTVNAVAESSSKVSAELKQEMANQAESLAKGTKLEAEVIATTKPQEAVITVAKSKPKVQEVSAELKQEPGSIHLKREGNLLEQERALQAEWKAKVQAEVKPEIPKQAESVKPQQDLAKTPKSKEVGRLSFETEGNLLEQERALQAKWNNI